MQILSTNCGHNENECVCVSVCIGIRYIPSIKCECYSPTTCAQVPVSAFYCDFILTGLHFLCELMCVYVWHVRVYAVMFAPKSV